jgi:hypothetical protein
MTLTGMVVWVTWRGLTAPQPPHPKPPFLAQSIGRVGASPLGKESP